MPSHLPKAPPRRQEVRSQIVTHPRGALLVGALLVGVGLLFVAVVSYSKRASGLAALSGLALLAVAWRVAVRSNSPMLLTLTRDALQLAPTGSSAEWGGAPETIPLASIRAYKYWLRLLRYQSFAQYHLRLELADGRVLHLADRPAPPPADPAGTVRLDAVVGKLRRWLPPGTRVRQLFCLTLTARLLLWLSWAALVAALGLLALGHPAGSLLLFPAAGYGASYYLGRGVAEITA